MTSLLGSFSESMTPEVLGTISRTVGIDMSQAQRGLDVVGPLVLGSLARKSTTTSGLDSVMRLIPQDSGGGFSGALGSARHEGPVAQASLLTGVLGPGVSTIGKALSGRLGFDASSLLAAAAPLILRTIGATARKKKLNSVGIAHILQEEHAAGMAAAKPDVKAVLNEAFQLGDKAEELKAAFSDDEWRQIRLSPLAVTFYVVSASPSGVTGLAKEVVAAGAATKSLVKDALPTSLVDVAFGSFEGTLALETEKGFDDQAPRSRALSVVQSAATAVKAKSPADATSFRDTLVSLSRKVAEASKEGGFLGLGGTRVSTAEEHALAEIAAAVA